MRAAAVTALIVVGALLGGTGDVSAGGQNVLRRPNVDPMSGSTATVFSFSVRYRSFANDPASSVTASVPGLTVPLTLVSGSAVNGTWSGSSSLPAGSWTVTFAADAQQFNDPTTTVGPVQVVPPPSPTPNPTPIPTPVPTPVPPPPPPPPPPPAPAPAVPAPVVTPAPTPGPATPLPTPSDPPSAGTAGPPAAAAVGDGVSPMGIAIGIGLATVVGVGGWWFVLARRRRDDAVSPAPAALAAPAGVSVAGHAAPSRVPESRKREFADWELASALDDAPIGTVDYDGRSGEIPSEIEAAVEAPIVHMVPGNARTRRMAEMHSWRDETDRRSLLRRVGLPQVDGD